MLSFVRRVLLENWLPGALRLLAITTPPLRHARSSFRKQFVQLPTRAIKEPGNRINYSISSFLSPIQPGRPPESCTHVEELKLQYFMCSVGPTRGLLVSSVKGAGVDTDLTLLLIVTLLRGAILNRTYGTHKTLYISLFLLTIFGPIYYAPP